MDGKKRETVYHGDLFEVRSTITYSSRENRIKIFETAHRPPGVRLLFRQNQSILLTRERRREIDGWDYRLPGGKVFDDYQAYSKCLGSPKLDDAILQAMVREAREEAGIIVTPKNGRLIYKSVVGASVVWDLFYFEITSFEESTSGQALEEGEEIDKPVWKSFAEVFQMCMSQEIREDRTAAVLLRYIHKNS